MSSVTLLSAHVVAFHLKPVAFFAIHPLFSLPYIAPFCFQYINWRTELSSKLTETTASLTKANNALNVIGTQYWSGLKDNYSYSSKETWVNNIVKITLPAGTYIFTLKASPKALGQNYDAFVIGITGISTTRTQKTFYMNYGAGYYPICTHTCVEKVSGGTYGVAFWSSQARNINGIEITATRIK